MSFSSILSAFGKSHDFIYARLHWFWLAVAAPVGFAMVFLTPPFQVPDEFAHYYRASQVSIGVFYGKRDPEKLTSGGDVPTSAVILSKMDGFHRMARDREVRIDILEATRTRPSSITWDSRREFFPNTSSIIYPPTSYILPAIGLRLGKLVKAKVLASFFLARFINYIAALLMCFFGLLLATRGKWFLATVLSMPMTLFEMASLSQDAFLFGCAALGAGLLSRLLDNPTTGGRDWWTIGSIFFLFTLMCAGRPVYAPVLIGSALLIALYRKDSARPALIAGSISLAVVIGWSVLASHLMVRAFATVDAGLQLRGILESPLGFIRIFVDTWRDEYRGLLSAFIGVLGWLDVPLQTASYNAYMILLAITLSFGSYYFLKDVKDSRRGFILVLLSCLASAALIFIVQYLTWTPVGHQRIGGVQGRYFIPIACFAMLAMKGRTFKTSLGGHAGSFFALFAVFVMCAVNIGAMFKILERFYY
ncbi:MAG: DUF2142 domain-containing protein [Syntrophobacteraceae bacterium]